MIWRQYALIPLIHLVCSPYESGVGGLWHSGRVSANAHNRFSSTYCHVHSDSHSNLDHIAHAYTDAGANRHRYSHRHIHVHTFPSANGNPTARLEKIRICHHRVVGTQQFCGW